MIKNPFVYDAIEARGLSVPFFDVNLAEQYGQCGEDLIVASLLRAWAIRHHQKMTDLTYLEIGANHPIATSSTWLLYHRYRIRGVLVEANPDLIDDLRQVRCDDTIIHAAVTDGLTQEITLLIPEANELATTVPDFLQKWQGNGGREQRRVTVKTRHINVILTQYFADRPLAYLSLDIEGYDLDILRSMDFEKFCPLIIQIEPSNHFIKNNDKKIQVFLEEKNYHFLSKTDVNMIFVHNSFYS